MRVSIICSNVLHPIMPYLEAWKKEQQSSGSRVKIVSESADLSSGDILFVVSCSEKITQHVRHRFRHVLVLHASDLPKGRGWSPYIWDILSGENEIILSLIEAEDQIDTGKIWKKIRIPVPNHFLWNEINHALFQGEIDLMNWAAEYSKTVVPLEQDQNIQPTYWPKRAVQDSCLDINKTIAEQFDLLRVCDPHRYPAFFEINGQKYKLILEKFDEKPD